MSMEFSCDCESISSLCPTWFRMFRSIIVRSITQGAGMMAFVAGGKGQFQAWSDFTGFLQDGLWDINSRRMAFFTLSMSYYSTSAT